MKCLRFKSVILACAAAVAACSTVSGVAQPRVSAAQGHGPFAFALIGDVPYGVLPGDDRGPEAVKFANIVADINADKKLRWVLHAGDIKSGGTPCSDDLYSDRLARYNRFEIPVILTPGDNEWTDCHRTSAGGYAPLERLARLREVFFSNPGITIGGRPMQVESQGNLAGYEEFPENVRWSMQGVLFAAIHIVGSDNGLASFPGRTAADDDEVQRRLLAGIDWLERSFALASAQDAPAVFIMIHANPGLERNEAIGAAFTDFIAALETQTLAYGKPVVLAHGDSHYFRVDKPGLIDQGFVKNFTRVETFGSSHFHWIRVEVDPNSRDVFTMRPIIVPEN